jgi:hypothetical protein
MHRLFPSRNTRPWRPFWLRFTEVREAVPVGPRGGGQSDGLRRSLKGLGNAPSDPFYTDDFIDPKSGYCLIARRNLVEGTPGGASVASLWAAVLPEIYLCNVRSCREILRRKGPG